MFTKPLPLAICAASVVISSIAPHASAETVVYQDGTSNALVAGYTGTQDNTLLSGSNTARNSNFGGFNTLFIGANRRVLLRFDLSSLSGEFDSIDSATLTLTAASAITGGNFSLYAVDEDNVGWVEGTSGSGGALGEVNAGESTWNHRNSPATDWAGGAGLVSGSDYDGTPVVSFATGTLSAGDTFDIILPNALVAEWADGTNTGLFITADVESTSPLLQVRSAENSTVGDRPELTIEYTVPEPGSMGLLGVAGAAVMLRRRRSVRVA